MLQFRSYRKTARLWKANNALVVRLLRHQYPRELLYCTPEEDTTVSKHVTCIYCDRTAEHSRVSHRNTQTADTPTCQKDERVSLLPNFNSRLQIDNFSNDDQGNFALGLCICGGGGSYRPYVAVSGQLHAPAVVPSVPFRFDARYRVIRKLQIQVPIILIYLLCPTT
jgi:hypothetical protein